MPSLAQRLLPKLFGSAGTPAQTANAAPDAATQATTPADDASTANAADHAATSDLSGGGGTQPVDTNDGDTPEFMHVDDAASESDKARAKSMQADYHRRTQKLNDAIKDAETAREKAALLDRILGADDQQAALTAVAQLTGRQAGQQGWNPEAYSKPFAELLAKEGVNEEVTGPVMKASATMAFDLVQRILAPYAPVIQWAQKQMSQVPVDEWTKVSDEFGASAEPYRAEAMKLSQRAEIPLRSAVFALAGDKLKPKAATPPAATQKPSTTAGLRVSRQNGERQPANGGGRREAAEAIWGGFLRGDQSGGN